MTPIGIAAAVAGGWIVLACVGATGWSIIANRLKRLASPPEVVTVQRVLPPVPPTRSELAWLRDQPVTTLRGEDLRIRFDDVINSARRAEDAR